MALALTQKNVRIVCELAGKVDVPVFAGCEAPLTRKLVTAEHVHCRTGLDGTDMPPPQTPLQDTPAAAFLIASIRNGDALNEGEQVARSTMSAIAGRMSAYTGRSMKWSWALEVSKLDLSPAKYEFGDLPVDPPAIPGVTKLV